MERKIVYFEEAGLQNAEKSLILAVCCCTNGDPKQEIKMPMIENLKDL